MALRILTGTLVPEPGKQGNGQAVIRFNPHQVTGDANGEKLAAQGDTGDFTANPSVVVSLQQVRVLDTGAFFGNAAELFRVVHDLPSTDQVEVEWATSNGGAIQRISYMILGDA